MSTSTVLPPAAAGEVPAASASLDRSLVRGIAWTGGAKWASQVATWGCTIVVARVLAPEDYGLVGMATIFLGLVTLLSEFGLGSAIVTLRDLTGDQLRQLNTVCVLFGIASFAVGAAAAAPLSWYFDAPALAPVVVVLSASFVVSGFRTVPYSLMQRDLAFRSLALRETVQAILVALATVLMALAGLGYWTLVFSPLLNMSLGTLLVVRRAPCGFAVPRRRSIGSALVYSWHVIVARLGWYVYGNADFFVVGSVLGKAALGNYGFAWTLANLPIEKVSALVMRVTPSYFAAVQKDPAALRRYFLRLTEGVAVITFPATVGMALVAEDFVAFALGDKWAGAVVPLQLLAVYAAFRSVTPLLPQVLNVVGKTRATMHYGIVAAVVLPLAFWVGSGWGLAGVAAAWIVAHPLVTFLGLYRPLFGTIGLSWSDYGRALWPAVSALLLMGIAVAGARYAAPAAWPPGVRLGLEVAVGAAVYLGVLVGGHRQRVEALRGVLAAARAG